MCSDIQVNWITFFGIFDNCLTSNEIIYWYNLLTEEKQLLKRSHKISAISDFCWHLLFWLLSCVKHSRKCVFQKNQNTTQNAKNEIWLKLVYLNTSSISKTKCTLKGITVRSLVIRWFYYPSMNAKCKVSTSFHNYRVWAEKDFFLCQTL